MTRGAWDGTHVLALVLRAEAAAHVAPQTHCAHRAIHGSPLETTGMVEQGYFSAWKVILR